MFNLVSKKLRREPVEVVLSPGVVVIMDLDRFEEFTREHGLDEYKPNYITGELTRLVEKLAIEKRGVVISGLDYDRGTEEAVIEFPYTSIEELKMDLEHILKRIRELGASITIVAVEGMVSCKVARDKKEAFHGTPWRDLATRILHEAKRSGGNKLVLL